MVDYMGSLIDPLAKVQQGQDYVNKIAAYGTQRQAGSQYASGDYRGAASTLARGGDIPAAAAVQKHGIEQAQAQHEYIRRAAPVFRAILAKEGPQGVTRAFQSIVPDLQRMNVPEDQIAEWGKRFQSDPAGTIQGLTAFAAKEIEWKVVGTTLVGVDKNNPNAEPIRIEGNQPLKYVPVAQGGSVKVFDPNQQNPAAQIPQPTSGAPPSAPAVGGAAAAQMPVAPVPVPVPQTAAAPVVAPQPPRPAAGAVQPSMQQRYPVAMAPDPQPPRPGIPPPDAPVVNMASAAQPEQNIPGYVGTIQGPPKPQAVGEQPFRPPTAQEQARYPGQAIQVNAVTGEVQTVGARGSGTPRLSPQQETDLRNLRVAVRDQAAVAADMQRFMALNQRVNTGTRYYFGIQKDLAATTDSDVSVMQSIIQRNVPRMRQGLPGAASDLDIKMFREALPALDRPRAANDSIARAAIAWSKRQQDYVSFLEDFARRNGTLLGANEKWSDYISANPLFQERGDVIDARRVTPWRQWFAKRGNAQQSQQNDGWSIQRVQ